MHVNLDHESMKKISLEGHNNLTKLNAKASSICGFGFHDTTSYDFGRTLAYQRGAYKGFSKFSNKVPKHLNKKEQRPYHPNHISNINYLDEHVFLNISFTSIKMISRE